MFRVDSLYLDTPPTRHSPVFKLRLRVLLLVFVLSPLLCTLTADGRQIPFETDGEQPKPPPKQSASAHEKPRAETNPVIPSQQFTATAYSLRGRTASGVNVRRGIISADRGLLPLGTRVRLEAGPYTGEYVVADTGGAVRGRAIEIWTPNAGEAVRFGRRAVKLTVLNRARPIPAFMRRELERRRSEKTVTDKDYQAELSELLSYEEHFYKAAARDAIKDERLHPNAIYSPVRYEADSPKEKSLLDTYFERIRLEADLIRNLITRPEYHGRVREIVAEEQAIIKRELHTGSEVADYYELTSRIAPVMELVKQANGPGWLGVSGATGWATIFVTMLGVLLPFYISYLKEKREGRAFELQKEELKLKIAQLEQQLMPPGNNLIAP